MEGAYLMRLHLNHLDEFREDYTPQFCTFSERRYEGDRIAVDNHFYQRCTFVNCNFVYSGGPFGFEDCEVSGGFLSPTGAARNFLELEMAFEQNDSPMPLL
jgi:hypothetical protein